MARCVAFNGNGTFQFTVMSSPVYTTREQGHFSVVLPLEKKQLLWYMWVTACVLELITLGHSGFSSMRLLKTQKTQAYGRTSC